MPNTVLGGNNDQTNQAVEWQFDDMPELINQRGEIVRDDEENDSDSTSDGSESSTESIENDNEERVFHQIRYQYNAHWYIILNLPHELSSGMLLNGLRAVVYQITDGPFNLSYHVGNPGNMDEGAICVTVWRGDRILEVDSVTHRSFVEDVLTREPDADQEPMPTWLPRVPDSGAMVSAMDAAYTMVQAEINGQFEDTRGDFLSYSNSNRLDPSRQENVNMAFENVGGVNTPSPGGDETRFTHTSPDEFEPSVTQLDMEPSYSDISAIFGDLKSKLIAARDHSGDELFDLIIPHMIQTITPDFIECLGAITSEQDPQLLGAFLLHHFQQTNMFELARLTVENAMHETKVYTSGNPDTTSSSRTLPSTSQVSLVPSTFLNFATLQNDLLKGAYKRKLSKLQYNKNLIARRREFMVWYDDISLLLQCHAETCTFVQDQDKVTVAQTESPATRALYGLLMSYCDTYYKSVVGRTPMRGDLALQTLCRLCASVSTSDKNFYNRLLLTVKLSPGENMTTFLKRFSHAKKSATDVGNKYSSVELIDIFLTAIEETNNALYLAERARLESDRIRNTLTDTFEEIEARFMSIDEGVARVQAKKGRANAATSSTMNPNLYGRVRQNGNQRQKRSGPHTPTNKKEDQSTSPTVADWIKNATCHACKKKGHLKRNCPTLKVHSNVAEESEKPLEFAGMATVAACSTRRDELTFTFIERGMGELIENWLPDTGASSHMTPFADDLFDIEDLEIPIGVILALKKEKSNCNFEQLKEQNLF